MNLKHFTIATFAGVTERIALLAHVVWMTVTVAVKPREGRRALAF